MSKFAPKFYSNVKTNFFSIDRSIIEETKSLRINSNDFKDKGQIGRGYFGSIYLVQEKATGNYFAMKKMKKSAVTTSQVKAERDIMACRKSEWITQLQYAFQVTITFINYIYLFFK